MIGIVPFGGYDKRRWDTSR